ncbi:MAG TPA: SDR family oxidoreductase [Candidatus Anoxymicrobiaceae bacterium]|jgi:short-subunit dehydrogenase
MARKDITGKWALVTGAGSGMGRTTSLELARAGANLILVDISGEALGRVAREVEALGRDCQTFCVDVTNWDQIKGMADTINSRYGALDILINNAGIAHMGFTIDTTFEEWRRLFDINVWSIIYMCKAFAPAMMKRKSGHIVNVSSGQAFFAVPTWGPYATTKFAVDGFSEALRYEMYMNGVGVSTVYPGIVRTPFYDSITGGFMVKVGMWFLMATASKPETVSKLTVKGIIKNKRMIIPAIMWPVYIFKPLAPLVFEISGRIVAWALRKEQRLGV